MAVLTKGGRAREVSKSVVYHRGALAVGLVEVETRFCPNPKIKVPARQRPMQHLNTQTQSHTGWALTYHFDSPAVSRARVRLFARLHRWAGLLHHGAAEEQGALRIEQAQLRHGFGVATFISKLLLPVLLLNDRLLLR